MEMEGSIFKLALSNNQVFKRLAIIPLDNGQI